jgi:hypothetical protein
MESQARKSGFRMKLDVNNWLDEPGVDWKLPIEKLDGVREPSETRTRIHITRLTEEIQLAIDNPTFQNNLVSTVKESYPFYLGKYLQIFVNQKEVEGEDLSFAESEYIKPGIEVWEDGNVNGVMFCGFLPRQKGIWTQEKSGWYLVCNGRVVVYADKSTLTGWGYKNILPQFQPKHRRFLGIVFLKSDHPEDLPWNTTKRGIYVDSPTYIRTLGRMISAARPVLQKLEKMYDSREEEDLKKEFKDSLNNLQTISATKDAAERSFSGKASRSFSFIPIRPKTSTMRSINFQVSEEELVRVKKCLGRPGMYNYEVGEKIFKYFMDRECQQ